MAAKTPITIVSSTSMSAKYVFTLRLGGVAGAGPAAVDRGSAGSASCHEARMTTGMSTAVMPIRTSAMPSTPTA